MSGNQSSLLFLVPESGGKLRCWSFFAKSPKELFAGFELARNRQDTVDHLRRALQEGDISPTTGAKVEERSLAISQFDHDGRPWLIARCQHRRAADERNSHLDSTQFFYAGKERIGVLHRGSRPIVRQPRLEEAQVDPRKLPELMLGVVICDRKSKSNNHTRFYQTPHPPRRQMRRVLLSLEIRLATEEWELVFVFEVLERIER